MEMVRNQRRYNRYVKYDRCPTDLHPQPMLQRESPKGCQGDFLRVYNGPPENSDIIGTYCGQKLNLPADCYIVARGNQLTLHFQSDEKVEQVASRSTWTYEYYGNFGFSLAWFWDTRCPDLPRRTGMNVFRRWASGSAAVGSRRTYGCESGYILSGGSKTRTCLEDGSWSGKASSCVACGGEFHAARGSIVFPPPGTPPVEDRVVCEWIINNSSTRSVIVNIENWNLQAVNASEYQNDWLCRRTSNYVTFLDTSNNKVISQFCKSNFPSISAVVSTSGVRIIYFANYIKKPFISGFKLSWKTGKVFKCQPLPTPTQSLVAFSPLHIKEGSTIRYKCIDNFYLTSGSETRTCLHDGTWSGDPPVCAPVGCGGTFETPVGSFEFPLRSFTYLQGFACLWTVNIPNAVSLELTVEAVNDSRYDIIEILEGKSPYSSRVTFPKHHRILTNYKQHSNRPWANDTYNLSVSIPRDDVGVPDRSRANDIYNFSVSIPRGYVGIKYKTGSKWRKGQLVSTGLKACWKADLCTGLSCDPERSFLARNVRGQCYCACNTGFSGEGCANDVCQHCVDVGVGTPYRLSDTQCYCSCPPAYFGQNCEIDTCAGYCDPVGSYLSNRTRSYGGQCACKCNEGFTEKDCSTDMCQGCLDVGHGTPIRFSNSCMCKCDHGYTGRNCELKAMSGCKRWSRWYCDASCGNFGTTLKKTCLDDDTTADSQTLQVACRAAPCRETCVAKCGGGPTRLWPKYRLTRPWRGGRGRVCVPNQKRSCWIRMQVLGELFYTIAGE